MAATKTLAFQISEELDQRLKNFIAAEKKRGRKISQKEFVIGLIEQALAEYEAQNQTKAMLWLWELKDVGVIGVGLLLSVLALTQTGIFIPLVLTAVYAFLSIRFDGTSILDFIRYAVAFLITRQQFYEWRM